MLNENGSAQGMPRSCPVAAAGLRGKIPSQRHHFTSGPQPGCARRWGSRGASWTTALLAACSLAAAASSGCGTWGYALSAVTGQLQYMSMAVPIDKALNDPELTEEQREKLAFVVRAREYAGEVVGLNVGSNYQSFVNLEGRALAYNLSASRKDRFEPYVWDLPVVGRLPYIGFFRKDQADAERDRLVKRGYDTMMYEVDAYSTLGLLPDPVSSTMLERDLFSLADTVMHELLHATIFKQGDTNFNESMATFVGETAGLEFLQFEFGPDSPVIERGLLQQQDTRRLDDFLRGVMEELEVLYASDISSEQKIADRELVFQAAQDRFVAEVLPLLNDPPRYEHYATLPINNAYILLHVRYTKDLEVFEQVYELTGRDWGQTLAIFRQSAGVQDSIGFLRGVVNGTQAVRPDGRRMASQYAAR